MKTAAKLSILVLLLRFSTFAQHEESWPPLSYLRNDYRSAAVVAHVLIREAEITGRVGGYENWRVACEVFESFKGRIRKGDVIEYFQGAEAGLKKEYFKGEKIIFLLAEYAEGKKTPRYSVLENSTLAHTADRARKLRMIRRSYAKRHSSHTTSQKVSKESKDEQELKRLEDEWLNTYLRGDKATFDRFVADDFTGTDESAVLRNKMQERELIQAPPSGAIKVSLTNEDVQVRIYGDTAIVTGRIVQKAERAGQDSFGFQSRFTDTFLKRQGRWQVVARHYSRIPLERTAIKVDPKIYDAYVGEYEIAPGIVLHVSKEGDKLMSQTTGQPKAEMFPESEMGFFVKGIPAQFIFIRDEKGQVARMIVLQDGRTISMKRIK